MDAAIRLHPNSGQGAQDTARPIDIINPPTAIPGPFRKLFTFQVIDGTLDSRVCRCPAVLAEALKDARCDVRARGVEHGVVVCEWNLVEQLPVIVLVKSAPAAVSVLHTDHPR